MSEHIDIQNVESPADRSRVNRWMSRIALGVLVVLGSTLAYQFGQDKGSEPTPVVRCGDGDVALDGGDFTQAARAAGTEAGATAVDYYEIASGLSNLATTPENPEGVAHSGESVRVLVDQDSHVVTYDLGTCQQPWPYGS